MHGKRVDENQKEIVKALRKIGCNTEPLSGCPGMPDLLVSLGSQIFLLEIKNPKTYGKTNRYQDKFHERFPTNVVRSPGEALDVVTKQFK